MPMTKKQLKARGEKAAASRKRNTRKRLKAEAKAAEARKLKAMGDQSEADAVERIENVDEPIDTAPPPPPDLGECQRRVLNAKVDHAENAVALALITTSHQTSGRELSDSKRALQHAYEDLLDS